VERVGAAGVIKLNGVIVALEGTTAGERGTGGTWTAQGLTMTVSALAEGADWRSDAELIFALDQGPVVGYRGFWSCAGG
jgi:hypothetical protein